MFKDGIITGFNDALAGPQVVAPGGGTTVSVTGITGIPTTATVGTLSLSGMVSPANATNKNIVWSIKSPGTTGATINGSTLTTTNAGTVTITATIANGKSAGTPYTKDFNITFTFTFFPVTSINGVSSVASIGNFNLSGTVEPDNASNKTIVWSVKSPGTTGAKISGSTFSTTADGTVTITATIANGKALGIPYT
jgi:endo-1,4-beta-xylanase